MARDAKVDEIDDEEEIQKEPFYQRIPKIGWIIIISLFIIAISLVSVYLTVKILKNLNNC